MACIKYSLINNSSSNGVFSYRRCADNMLFTGVQIAPNQTKNIWAQSNSFSVESGSFQVIEDDTSDNVCGVGQTILLTFFPETPTTETIIVQGSSVFKLTLNWGDGTEEIYQGATQYTINHIYAVGQTYSATLDFDNKSLITSLQVSNGSLTNIYSVNLLNNISDLFLYGNKITNFDPIFELPTSLQRLDISNNPISNFNPVHPLPSGLTYFSIANTNISNFNPSFDLPDSLIYLYLYGCNISNFNPTNSLPTGLQFLNLSDNPITSFNPTISLPSNLLYLDLSNCNLTGFNPTIALPNGMTGLNLSDNAILQFQPSNFLPNSLQFFSVSNNALTEFYVNTALVFLVSNSFTSGDFYLDGAGNGIASFGPPDGLAALLTLVGAGCGVYVNT